MAFLAAMWPYNPDHPDFDEDEGADTTLYLRDSSWYYRVWGVVVRPADLAKSPMDYLQYCYEVTCYLYSPYSEGASQAISSASTSLANSTGHIASSPDVSITCGYSAGKAQVVTAAIADSYSLVLATVALSSEIWQLVGNEDRLLESYTDAIASKTQFDQDVSQAGTISYSSGYISLDTDGAYAIYRLSGPHRARYPVVMTADLSQVSGLSHIDISADGISWEEILDEEDYQSGAAEYVLAGTEFMTDIYVRFYRETGALHIASLKFEVERWIEAGAVPVVAAGATKTLTVSATGGALAVSGSFRPRRMFV